MRVLVNGESLELERRLSIGELVAHLGHDRALVAVERNQDVVPRATWDEALLAEGDEVEVVTFVGGG